MKNENVVGYERNAIPATTYPRKEDGREGFVLFTNGFSHRIRGEISIGKNVRLQDTLNTLDDSYMQVLKAKWFEYNNGVYTPTTRTRNKDARAGGIRIDIIDLIYPLRKFQDANQAKAAYDLLDPVEIEFPMDGLEEYHIRGSVLVYRLPDKAKDMQKSIYERVESKLEAKLKNGNNKFIAIINPSAVDENGKVTDELEVRLSLLKRISEDSSNAILVNVGKIKHFELVDGY